MLEAVVLVQPQQATLERLVATLAVDFLGIEPADVDAGIDAALKAIGQFAGVDRAYVFALDNATTMSNTHEWCAPGIEPMKDHLQQVPVDVYPWMWTELSSDRTINVAHLDDLPPAAAEDKAGLAEQGIVSLCVVPVMDHGGLAGFVGFDSVDEPAHWTSDDVELLRAVGEMFRHAVDHGADRRRIDELMVAKDEFLAAISHELRTPLTAVVGLASELEHDLGRFDPQELTEFIAIIAAQGREVAQIIEDLLVVARSDIGQLTVQVTEVDLRAEVEAVLEGLPGVRAKVLVTDPGGVVAKADANRVRQIVRNLLTNACRHGGDSIEVSLSSALGFASVRVTDDGDGVAPEDVERIFDPYHRSRRSLTQPSSIGLGLTVSRRLARLMRGDLRYDGAASPTFELTLPAA